MKRSMFVLIFFLLLAGCGHVTEQTSPTPSHSPKPIVVPSPSPSPEPSLPPDELFRSAKTELNEGRPLTARKMFYQILNNYPETKEAKEAKSAIEFIEGVSAEEKAQKLAIRQGNFPPTPSPTPADAQPTDTSDWIPVDDNAKMTMADFLSIKEGMRLYDVVKIVGGTGELLSEGYGTEIYSYEGVGDLGANAIITYTDGKVVSKAQYGLK
ncbi:hypothetical protein [Paenibacillus sabinae]|uniref:Lipoprotein n=1 Tax=Paenibacillus sabinae T27 TaxID=1268072 RepID=X5A3S9_9BACL|nr:hypothetical protein [Paenibacillus sabinae]AHV98968.1 hypothetical protein PSAB_20385 [Paenibacillus sabinae T27]